MFVSDDWAMRPSRSLPASTSLWTAWGRSGALAAGPAMTVLRSVVRRVAATGAAFGASYALVQVAIWHGYYAAHPWLLAGPSPPWPGAAPPSRTCVAATRPGP